MPDIYFADNTDYIVANTFEGAAETYADVRNKQAETLTKTYGASKVIMGLTKYNTVMTVSEDSLLDNCAVYPSSFEVQENSEIPITAVDGDTLVFSEWQDVNGATISTDNPYIHTVTEDTEIVGIFV